MSTLSKQQLLDQLKQATGQYANVDFTSTNGWSNDELFLFGVLLAIANNETNLTQDIIEANLLSAFSVSKLQLDSRLGSDAYLWDANKLALLAAATAVANKLGTNSNNQDNITNLPDSYEVFVSAGQSNADGAGLTYNELYDYTDPRIFQYCPGSNSVSYKLLLAKERLFNIEGSSFQSENRITFVTHFAKRFLQENPTKQVVLLRCPRGNTGFISNEWGIGKNLSIITEQTIDRFMSEFPNSNLRGMLWHQGERDMSDNNPISTYSNQVLDWFDYLQNKYSNFTIVTGGFSTNWATGSITKLRYEKFYREINRDRSYIGYAESTSLTGNPGDEIHFDAPALREFGRRYHNAYKLAKDYVATKPIQPINIVVQPFRESVRVEWDMSSYLSKLYDYSVSWKLESQSNYPIANNTPITRYGNITIGRLQPNTNYKIKVVAINSLGVTDSQEFSVTTPFGGITLPTPIVRLTFENSLGDNSGSGDDFGTMNPPQRVYDSERGSFVAEFNGDSGLNAYFAVPVTYTKCCWVKLSFYGNGQPSGLINVPNSLSVHNLEIGGLTYTGVFHAHSNFNKLATTNRTPELNQWFHLATTYNNTTKQIKIYWNGVEVVNDILSTALQNNTDPTRMFSIGIIDWGFGGLFGRLDNVEFYDQVLTNEQIIKSMYS